MGNDREVWLNIKDAALIHHRHEKTIFRRMQAGQFVIRWVASQGCKGAKIEVALSSLPELIQERYWRQRCPKLFEGKDTTWMMRGSKKKHETAGLRKDLLEKLNDELNNRDGRSKTEIIEGFVHKYNAAEIDERILAILGPRTVRTFNRWRREDRDYGMEGLVPGWTSKTFDELPIDEKVLLHSLWLNENRPSVAFVYRKYKEEGFDTLTLARVRAYLNRIPDAVKCRYREGKKAYKDRFGQYIERDYSKVRANEIWVGDHCQLDFAIEGFNGKALFPWITVWMDIRSRKVMGFCIHPSPCTETIVASFRSAALKHGLPEQVLIDNGKDFSSRRFSGGRKRSRLRIDKRKMTSLLHGLKVEARFCNPYNPRSKPVERFFRTMKDDFEKGWDTYRGRYRGKERPEGLEAVLKDPSRLPGLPEVDAALQAWIEEYHARPHRGQAMDGKSPDQVWRETLGEKREVDPERLRLAMMVAEDRMIRRNGISIFGQVYWDEAMWRYKGKRVRVRYDVHDLGRIDVYDQEENRYLFTAECRPMAQWRACQDDIKRAQKEGREERKQVEEFANVVHRGRRGMQPAARAIQTKRDSLISRQEENPGMPARRPACRSLAAGRTSSLAGGEDDGNELHNLVAQRKGLSGSTAESGSDDGSRRRPIFKYYWEKEDWERRERARADSDGEETGEIH